MRWILCVFALFVSACVQPIVEPKEPIVPSFSLDKLAQNLDYTLTKETQERLIADYRQRHFGIWTQQPQTDWSWVVETARKNPGIGENLLPNAPQTIEELIANANFDSQPLWQAAIVVADSPLRQLPTNKPYFLPQSIAGEGYPFDHWQNSAIFSQTPIIIERASVDGAWLLVHSSFVAGWIESRNVAMMRPSDQKTMQNLSLFVPITDFASLLSKSGLWLDNMRIGKVFVGQATQNGIIAHIAKRDVLGNVSWQKTRPTRQLQDFALDFTPQNVQMIAAQLLGEKYGWGGLLGNRDCSAMLRDFWTSFGLWLPRNSSAQIQHDIGEAFDLSAFAPNDKEQQILQKGLPWGSLLWLSGHIVMFVGEDNGKAIVFHNLWGLRVIEQGVEGRAIIGRSVFSTLWLGSELPHRVPNMLLIDRIQTMRNLFAPNDIIKKENNE